MYKRQGYEMMPEMAIIDADNMMKLPPRATQASGYDVLTHAVEAYVSTFATEYTNGCLLYTSRCV